MSHKCQWLWAPLVEPCWDIRCQFCSVPLGRLGYYALGKAGVQQLVYVDDFLTNGSKGIGQTVLLIFLYVVLGLPFTWKKFRGGVELTWVGFEIVLKGAKLGLSICALNGW